MEVPEVKPGELFLWLWYGAMSCEAAFYFVLQPYAQFKRWMGRDAVE
jgi:hypothetical protein